MALSDSDSDDFFSGIRQLRHQFGLSSAQTPKPTPPTKAATQSQTQLASKPQTPSNRESLSTDTTTPSNAFMHLSPKLRKQATPASSRIPPRTPQSRVASPYTPRRSTPAMAKSVERPQMCTPTVTSARRMGKLATPVGFQLFGNQLEDSETPKEFRSIWAQDSPRSPLVQTATAGSSRRVGTVGLRGLGSPESNGSVGSGLLGSVEEALVTEADIDVAKRKLGEEQAVTQQQILREIRGRLVEFADRSLSTIDALEESSSMKAVAGPVTLLCQFYTLGHGRLAYSDTGLVWTGTALGEIATVAQSNLGGIASECENTVLLFPWARVTGLRRKPVDGQELVLMTVDDDLGIGFQGTTDGWQGEDIEELVVRMRVAMESAQKLQRRQKQQLQRDRLVPGAPAMGRVGPGSIDAEMRVIGGLLEMSQQTSGPKLDRLEIAAVLDDPQFWAYARPLVRELSIALAKNARKTIATELASGITAAAEEAAGTEEEEDPGTDTLPGVCTLCYSSNEAIGLQPCGHRLCTACFTHLKSMQQQQQPREASGAEKTVCMCPWDRSLITEWQEISQ